MGSIVRKFQPDDTASVVRLSLEAWAPVFASTREVMGSQLDERLHGRDWRSYQQASVERVLADEGAEIWVAETEGRVAGFVAVIVHADRRIAEIAMLAVAPDAQGRGFGTELTTTATDWIRAAGIPVAMVETGGDPGHAPARRTYEKADYHLVPVARYFKTL